MKIRQSAMLIANNHSGRGQPHGSLDVGVNCSVLLLAVEETFLGRM